MAAYDDAILPSKRMMEGQLRPTHHTPTRLTARPFRLAAMEVDRQLHLRETAVRSAEVKLVKQTLDQCALTEGVNALENCDKLVRQYLRMMKTHKVRLWPAFLLSLGRSGARPLPCVGLPSSLGRNGPSPQGELAKPRSSAHLPKPEDATPPPARFFLSPPFRAYPELHEARRETSPASPARPG